MNKNVGVFLSAAFLVGVKLEHRNPLELTSKVEEATRRVLVAGEPTVRVIVADCADENQRLIAESFALQAGFRIRHAPALGPSVSTTLGAEVLGAVAADADLRVVAIGDEPVTQAATLEALSALKRWTVLISADAARRIDLADAVLGLALDPRPLFDVLAEVLTEAIDRRDFDAIHKETQRRFGLFSPKTYGFASTEALVKAAQKRAPKQTRVTEHADAAAKKHPGATKPSAQLTDRREIRRTALAMETLDELDVATLSDLELGRIVLTRLEATPFRSFTRTTGVDMHLFLDCIRHLTAQPKWSPEGISTPELMMQIASAHPGWSVGVPPDGAGARFVSLPDLPASWTPFTPRVDKETTAVSVYDSF